MSMIINPYVFAAAGGGAVPNAIPNIWAWYEPSRETGLSDNDLMPTLTDQSGNGRHFTQSNSSFRPIYKSGILNSLACARGTGGITGAHEHWVGPSMTALTAAHAFIVVKCDSEAIGTADNGLWRFGTAADSDHYPWSDNNIYDGTLSSTRKTVGSHAALTSWRVTEVVSISGEWTFKIDGTQLFTTGTNTVSGRSNPGLLTTSVAGGGDFFKGYFAGLYIFSAKLTTDRTTLITYINDRFALSSS